MSQNDPIKADQWEGDEPDPVVFYDAEPPAPLLGPWGVLLAAATFFYFFL